MIGTFPRQLKYDLFIGNGKESATDLVTGPVKISLDESRMAHLTFSLKNPDVNLDWLRMGTNVKFYGGYTDRVNPLDQGQGGSGYRMLFSGNIFRVSTTINEAGVPIGSIECIDAFYTTGGYSPKQYRYPSKNCPRNWASGSTVKVSEIVKNICLELNIDYEISLGKDSDKLYSYTDTVVQDSQTDWDFLVTLATRCGCYCWTTIENEKTKLFFIEQGKSFSSNDSLEFVVISRRNNEFFTPSYSGRTSVQNELGKLKDNQVLLYEVSVTEDPGMYGQHTYKVTDFDSATGEQKDLLVNYEEDSDTITYYELDSALIESMNKTPAGSRELDRILGMGALSIPWAEAKKYYKEVNIPAGKLDALGGVGFLGVTISATCRGDLRVLPYKSYLVNGVVRGRNMQRKSNKFYVKSLAYVFDNSGFNIELEFIA
jgi:hypothetical protein